jgi:hypothetical protein
VLLLARRNDGLHSILKNFVEKKRLEQQKSKQRGEEDEDEDDDGGGDVRGGVGGGRGGSKGRGKRVEKHPQGTAKKKVRNRKEWSG